MDHCGQRSRLEEVRPDLPCVPRSVHGQATLVLYGTGQAFFEQGSELNGFVVALSTSSLRKTFSVARCGAAQRV
jgi:hypothetical protein